MCIATPKAPTITPSPTIVNRDDEQVRQARDRRLRLGNQTGGNLATRMVLGNNTDNRVKLGG